MFMKQLLQIVQHDAIQLYNVLYYIREQRKRKINETYTLKKMKSLFVIFF